MKKVQLIFVGGFLGAGKTTLLWRAAERLTQRGQRVGLITNDQAPNLVDTKWLAEEGLNVREVAGSCFCCNFAGLIYAAEKLLAAEAQVLLAEPVGSCTDLSATILQPLKDRFRERFVLSPLSVLADPLRLRDVLDDAPDTLHPDAAYIYRKQLEEADVIVVNKADVLSTEQRNRTQDLLAAQFPGAVVRFLSARTGEGLEPWLDEVLAGPDGGARIVEVDYDTYAHGEAVLGWLNADLRLSAVSAPVNWRTFCSELLGCLQTQFREGNARIGHVKLLLTAGGGHCMGSLTDQRAAPILQGEIDEPAAQATLTLNARVEMPPEALERIVRTALAQTAGSYVRMETPHLQCLRPGRPQPTHRYNRIVG